MKTPVIDVLSTKNQTQRGVATVAPSDSVAEAVRRMNTRRIGSVIVRGDGRTLGIFTERDVLTRVVAEKRDPDRTPVSEVMTDELYTLGPDTTVERAMSIISETRCRHMPVMDGDELIGVISIGDLTRWLVRHQRIHMRELERYVARAPAASAVA